MSDLREAIERECPESKRLDGKHTWRFWGDDPYIYCHFCGEMRDALTGQALGGSDEHKPNAEMVRDIPDRTGEHRYAMWRDRQASCPECGSCFAFATRAGIFCAKCGNQKAGGSASSDG